MRLILLLIFALSFCIASTPISDSITIKKIEKLVQKEEDIAKAYKEHLLKYGKKPSEIKKDLVDNNLLPQGFDTLNPFGKEIKLVPKTVNNISIGYEIERFTTNDSTLNSTLNYYYNTDIFRKFTKSSQKNNQNIVIPLNLTEKFINDNQDIITNQKNSAKGKYLIENGVLSWYDNDGNYKFSIAKDIISKDKLVIEGKNNTLNPILSTSTNKLSSLLYVGQKIYQNSSKNQLDEFLYLGKKILKLENKTKNEIILKSNLNGSGIIINGNIYTWGKNSSKTISIGNNSYTTNSGVTGTGTAIINNMVRSRAINYDNDTAPETNTENSEKFYSSANRVRFINLYIDNNKALCAISDNSELYCGGEDVLETNYIAFTGYTKSSKTNMDYLYRSPFFGNTSSNGTIVNKANDVLFVNNTYIVATNNGLYFWGKDNSNGFAGTGLNIERNVFSPTKSTLTDSTEYKNLFYSSTLNKIFALGSDKKLYRWGQLANQDCNATKMCSPTLIDFGKDFLINSVEQKGIQIVVADDSNIYYRLIEANGLFSKKLVQDDINLVSTLEDDKNILSFDYVQNSNNLPDILWVNSKNQLKGNLNFSGTADEKKLFDYTISQLSWEKVKVIGKNAICALDTNKQMYCWGDLSNTNNDGYILPIFASNLQDLDKDYIFIENKNGTITTISSGDWIKNSKFFIKYPTFIGGFNYDVIFK